VWRVQRSGKSPGGVVDSAWGFNDSPDAELLAAGFQSKEYAGLAVARHGNFLQWGFSAPPSKMFGAGRRFFVNCICYVHKFDGKGPLIRRGRAARRETLRLAPLITRIKDKGFFGQSISPELLQKYENDPNGLGQYYLDNYELIYWDKYYVIDRDLEALGLKSNRTLETLERLIALLADEKHAATARRLLGRYTNASFETHAQWRAWFRQSRDRIFFSDKGGYKFHVIPKGYPIALSWRRISAR